MRILLQLSLSATVIAALVCRAHNDCLECVCYKSGKVERMLRFCSAFIAALTGWSSVTCS